MARRVLAAVVVMGLGLGACSSTDEPQAKPTTSASASATSDPDAITVPDAVPVLKAEKDYALVSTVGPKDAAGRMISPVAWLSPTTLLASAFTRAEAPVSYEVVDVVKGTTSPMSGPLGTPSNAFVRYRGVDADWIVWSTRDSASVGDPQWSIHTQERSTGMVRTIASTPERRPGRAQLVDVDLEDGVVYYNYVTSPSHHRVLAVPADGSKAPRLVLDKASVAAIDDDRLVYETDGGSTERFVERSLRTGEDTPLFTSTERHPGCGVAAESGVLVSCWRPTTSGPSVLTVQDPRGTFTLTGKGIGGNLWLSRGFVVMRIGDQGKVFVLDLTTRRFSQLRLGRDASQILLRGDLLTFSTDRGDRRAYKTIRLLHGS